MEVSRDPFEWWYAVAEIARRVGKHPRSIKRAVARGEFGARPGEESFKGRIIGGEMFLPWSAVAFFLKLPASPLQARSVAWRARSEGELRRQLEAAT